MQVVESSLLSQVQESGKLICVVDDDEAVRRCLERLFRSARYPVKTFASAQEYLETGRRPEAVCLVLDVEMEGMSGFELQSALADRGEQIVFLTGHGDVPMCARALKAGAVDFLTKPVDDELLLSAVAAALGKACELGASHAQQAAAIAILRSLTPREADVMRGVTAGMLNKQIAAKLGISEKTVKSHRGRMMKRTGTVSVPELIRLVAQAGGLAAALDSEIVS